jgi:hypothetical protein
MKIQTSAKVTINPQMSGEVIHQKLVQATMLTAEKIMADSKDLVPVDTGTLRSSGVVLPAAITGTTVSVTLGYGGAAAPYARMVHENPRAGKTGGLSPSGMPYKTWAKVGQWKFLEIPFVRARNEDYLGRFFRSLTK